MKALIQKQSLKKLFVKEIKALPDQSKLNKRLVLDMYEQAKDLFEYVIPEMKRYFGDYKVFKIEDPLYEPIKEFETDFNFKGFIDLVIKTEDGKYHIIDWKTCSWGWSRDKKSDPMTTYQLTYYKNYFSKKHNIEPNKIETYFVLLKRTAKKDNVEVLRVTSGHKKTINALKVLENAVINIERGVQLKNRLNCKYCKFYKTENCT